MGFPRDGGDYPLWMLIAAKKSLYRFMEDPTLEDSRWVLDKIDEALGEGILVAVIQADHE